MGKVPTAPVRSGKGNRKLVHGGSRLFQCRHCASIFTLETNRTKHERIFHREGALVKPRIEARTEEMVHVQRERWREAKAVQRARKASKPDDKEGVQPSGHFSCSATGDRITVQEVVNMSTMSTGQQLAHIGLAYVASTSGPVGLLLKFTERGRGRPFVTFDCVWLDQETQQAITRGILCTVRICDWPEAVDDARLECIRPGAWLGSAGVLVQVVPQQTPINGASVALAASLAMFSLMAGRPLFRNTAASGLVTLAGRVLEVQDLTQKRLTCHEHGVKALFLSSLGPVQGHVPFGLIEFQDDNLLPFFRTFSIDKSAPPTTEHLSGLSYKDEMCWWPKTVKGGSSGEEEMEAAGAASSVFGPQAPRHAVIGFSDTLLLASGVVADTVTEEGEEEAKETRGRAEAALGWRRVSMTVIACRGQGQMTLLCQPNYHPLNLLRDWLAKNAARVDGLPSDWSEWDVWVDLPYAVEMGPHNGALTGAILVALIRAFRGTRQPAGPPTAVLVPLLGLGDEVMGGYGPCPVTGQADLLAVLQREGLRLLCPRGCLASLQTPAAAAKVWVDGVSNVAELLSLAVPGALHADSAARPLITTLADIRVLRLPDWEGQETTEVMEGPVNGDGTVMGLRLDVYGEHCWDMHVELRNSDDEDKQIARTFVYPDTLLFYKPRPEEHLCLELRAGPGHRYLLTPQSKTERLRLYSLSRLAPRLVMPVENTFSFCRDRACDPKAAVAFDMGVSDWTAGGPSAPAHEDSGTRSPEPSGHGVSNFSRLPPEAQRCGLL